MSSEIDVMIFRPYRFRTLVLAGVLAIPVASQAQLRVATWNITNWNPTASTNNNAAFTARKEAFRTALYGIFQSRQFAPDVLFIQEVQTQYALDRFVEVMNTAPGSPGDWAAEQFFSGPDTQQCMLYRTSKVTLVPDNPDAIPPYSNPFIITTTGASPEPPRNVPRHDFWVKGYENTAEGLISVYNTHMKSASDSTSQNRRLLECQRIRDNAETLSPRGAIMVLGDFNMQSNTQAAWIELTGSQVNNTPRMFDPINSAGNWNNNPNYRFIHTQDPYMAPNVTNQGMDDRLDFILTSAPALDGEGLTYIGNPNIAYSTTTWNDPNHSYRCWGNDGTSFRLESGNWNSYGITITGNTMVGATIAQALLDSTGNSIGHLPVFMDMRVPGRQSVNTSVVDLGYVNRGTTVTVPIQITNTANTALWTTAGISSVKVSFSGTGGWSGPAGFSFVPAGQTSNFNLTLDTSTSGRKDGVITITTNDPVTPIHTISCSAIVAGGVALPPRVPRP